MLKSLEIEGMSIFVLVWLGQLVSLLGSSITNFALDIWVYQRSNSVTQLSQLILLTTLFNCRSIPERTIGARGLSPHQSYACTGVPSAYRINMGEYIEVAFPSIFFWILGKACLIRFSIPWRATFDSRGENGVGTERTFKLYNMRVSLSLSVG